MNFDLRRIKDQTIRIYSTRKGKQLETVIKRYHRRYIIYYSPARQRWCYTLVNFHWARVRFGPVPLASCRNGSTVNSPAAVYFTVLSQTPRRPSYFQSSTIALDIGLLLKVKMPIRDLTTELEFRSNIDPSDILD